MNELIHSFIRPFSPLTSAILVCTHVSCVCLNLSRVMLWPVRCHQGLLTRVFRRCVLNYCPSASLTDVHTCVTQHYVASSFTTEWCGGILVVSPHLQSHGVEGQGCGFSCQLQFAAVVQSSLQSMELGGGMYTYTDSRMHCR